MFSILFAAALFGYALVQILSTRGARFQVDVVLWCLSWGGLFALNGILGWPYIQSELTNTLVFVYVLCFIFGHTVKFKKELSAIPIAPQQALNQARSTLKLPGIVLIVLIASVIGLAAPYEMLKSGGFGVDNLVGGGSYGDVISTINGDYRTGLIEQTMIGKFAFAAPQAAMILVGIMAVIGGYKAGKRYFLVALAAAPLILFTAVSTIRSPTFMALLLLVTGTIAGRTMLGREKSLFKLRNFLIALVTCFALVLMMFFFQSMRLGDYSFQQTAKTIEHMRIWFAGYLPAFNGWVWKSWNGRLNYGASCFRFLPAVMTGQTSYLDTFQSNVYIGNQTYGNASTMLRVVVNDWGLIGCGVFLFIWGAISRFLLTITRRGSIVGGILFTCNLAAIVWSPNQWYFLYGSRVLAPAIAISYLLVRRVRLRKFNAKPLTQGVLSTHAT